MCRAEARACVLCVHMCVHYIHGHNVHRIYRSPQRQHEERTHIMVCAECPDLALCLPLIDLLCDLGQVTYPLSGP